MNCYRRSSVIAGFIITSVLIAVVLCGCIAPEQGTGNATKNTSMTTATPAVTTTPAPAKTVPETIRVVKFEPTRPCYSCALLGNYAKETIEVYFPEEYASGQITYETVNYLDPQNGELVRKYGASGSALFIAVIRNDDEEIRSANDMWRYIGNKEEYMSVFRSKLDALLKGEDHA